MLCYRPQPFTVRTKRLCQLLRLNRTAFLSIVQANVGDGTIIMNNLLQVLIYTFKQIKEKKGKKKKGKPTIIIYASNELRTLYINL